MYRLRRMRVEMSEENYYDVIEEIKGDIIKRWYSPFLISNVWLHSKGRCARINDRCKTMKKNDYVLIAGILLAAVILLVVFQRGWSGDGAVVEVTVGGKVYGEYRLDKDQTIEIHNTNLLEIRDGKADMIDADCPDKLCVEQKAISKNGESIVCLPNQVVVTVTTGEQTENDAVAN